MPILCVPTSHSRSFGLLSVLVSLEAGVEMGLEHQVLTRATTVERKGKSGLGQWEKVACSRAAAEHHSTSTPLPWIRTMVLEGKLPFTHLFAWNGLHKIGGMVILLDRDCNTLSAWGGAKPPQGFS